VLTFWGVLRFKRPSSQLHKQKPGIAPGFFAFNPLSSLEDRARQSPTTCLRRPTPPGCQQ
jgi:hypothetical protein